MTSKIAMLTHLMGGFKGKTTHWVKGKGDKGKKSRMILGGDAETVQSKKWG